VLRGNPGKDVRQLDTLGRGEVTADDARLIAQRLRIPL
jgi:hypothetical protein